MISIDHLALFLRYLIDERHYSLQTKLAYEDDVTHFFEFLEETGNSDYLTISFQDARVYLAYLHDKEYSRNTISRKISSLRSFYQFLIKNEWIKDNPFSYIQMKKKQNKLPSFLYEKEIAILFDSVSGQSLLDKRNRALLELLYATGIRVSECVSIELNDLDMDNGIVLINGKGGKQRYVPFGSFCADALQEYLTTTRVELMAKYHCTHETLFINHHGQELTAKGVQYILDKLIKQSSLTTNIHPHIFRHTFATHLLDNGADMRTVQELLGHSSLSSTQIYTHVTTSALQKNYRNFHPRA
ncbi:tyrosine recombinase XerC [Vagococcus bubulae]|uniref:Tyrosine recombinase XerC n=1 Tax=Vagococcus bubulae TaxID=1977868 RepID=A0A429ZRR8_9ENTE|nr:tyrosine recombinase XerC [Vagococcus bubulae]RST96361.1 tyrosine recombinase XerC [Vagococcus bubulae]